MAKRKGYISTWNAQIDRSKTVYRIGRNGIHYEYVLPLYGDPMHYYEDAVSVKSHKSPTTRYYNGKKPGQYQPIGDRSYFTFYQLKKIKDKQRKEEENKTMKINIVFEV